MSCFFKIAALGTALFLPVTSALAHPKIHALQVHQTVAAKADHTPLKCSPILGMEMGVRIAFGEQVTLRVTGGFLQGLHANSTLHIRF